MRYGDVYVVRVFHIGDFSFGFVPGVGFNSSCVYVYCFFFQIKDKHCPITTCEFLNRIFVVNFMWTLE